MKRSAPTKKPGGDKIMARKVTPTKDDEYQRLRLLSRVLNMYYKEGVSQADIARSLDLSISKVSRLLSQARDEGVVEITFRLPYQHSLDQADRLQASFGLEEVVVVPTVWPSEPAMAEIAGQVAANVLARRLRDGDLVAISGGRTVHALVQALKVKRRYNVSVVPMMGGVQGSGTLDVNYLALSLAEKLGGKAYQLHAPLTVDSAEQREALISMRPVKEILDLARQANVAVVGIGSIKYNGVFGRATTGLPGYGRTSASIPKDLQAIIDDHGDLGQIAARIYDPNGRPSVNEYDSRVVGLGLDEIKKIPLTVAAAADPVKAIGILGALRGGLVKILVTDEAAADAVLEYVDRQHRG